jgi:hypothetical protein
MGHLQSLLIWDPNLKVKVAMTQFHLQTGTTREVLVFTERCKLFVVNLLLLVDSRPIETPQNQPLLSLMDEVSSNWPSGLYQRQAFRLIYHAQLEFLSPLRRSKTNLSHRTLISLASSFKLPLIEQKNPSHFRSKGKWRMLLSDP